MFPSLPQTVQEELAQLAQQFSQPLVRTVDLGKMSMFDPLNKTDRYGEVCMVVRRRNGHLLTMKKTTYPKGAYRLMTGGINYGESVLHALLRETYEETGLQARVSRFLAAVAYKAAWSHEKPIFYTFAFLLDEQSGTLGTIDQHERVESFLEIEPQQLSQVAEHLEQQSNAYDQKIDGYWSEWGRFRAVIHRFVLEALQENIHQIPR